MFAMKSVFVKKKSFRLYLTMGLAALLGSCASQAPLGGGPKDETPPKLLSCSPENRSVNFSGKEIELTFDEFISLKSVQQKLVVSPPMEEKPEVISKTRSVIIKFKENLLPNTTYTLNFSDAIADLNEGNSIPDFHFCFSTGPVLDSLKVSGSIIDAFSFKPENGMFVMLYNDTLDSVPVKKLPYYIAKTNSNGNFSIENIKKGRYKLFALSDANSNLLFDLPNEKIAYIDSIVIPSVIQKSQSDTLKKGSLIKISETQTDTLQKDSIITRHTIAYSPENRSLYSFEEDRLKQFLKSINRPYKNKCFALFNRKPFGPVTVNGINIKHFLVEQGINGDSLTLWLTDSLEYKNDTVRFQITYVKKDSADILYNFIDSATFIFKETNKKSPAILKFSSAVSVLNDQQWQSQYPVRLSFGSPVISFSPDSIILEEAPDSVFHKIKPIIENSKHSPCVYYIKYPWKDEIRYRLRIAKGKIKDIYGNVNDTIGRTFKTYSLDYYSTAMFNIQGPENFYVFQMTDASGKVVLEWPGNLPYTKSVNFLLPGKYRLRAFVDNNKNGKWDTGFYLKHRQPEKVFLCPDEINLRSNWEVEVKWEIKE